MNCWLDLVVVALSLIILIEMVLLMGITLRGASFWFDGAVMYCFIACLYFE